MVAAKRYWVTVKAPPSLLETLPEFPTPISKTRQKKIAEGKLPPPTPTSFTSNAKAKGKSGNSSTSSPAQDSKNKSNKSKPTGNPGLNAANQGAISNFKINSGLKESSTSGLTMNSISNGLYALDKSGSPCKRWVKKPREFKTFSGFKVKYISYDHADAQDAETNEVMKDEDSQSQPPEIGSEA